MEKGVEVGVGWGWGGISIYKHVRHFLYLFKSHNKPDRYTLQRKNLGLAHLAGCSKDRIYIQFQFSLW